jgi:hypothetical protein
VIRFVELIIVIRCINVNNYFSLSQKNLVGDCGYAPLPLRIGFTDRLPKLSTLITLKLYGQTSFSPNTVPSPQGPPVFSAGASTTSVSVVSTGAGAVASPQAVSVVNAARAARVTIVFILASF